jgi:hypothetical protein
MMKFFRRATAAMAFLVAVFVGIPAPAQAQPLRLDAMPTATYPAPGNYSVQIDFHRDVQWLLRFWYIYVSREKTPEGRPAYVTYYIQYWNVNPLADGRGPVGRGPFRLSAFHRQESKVCYA